MKVQVFFSLTQHGTPFGETINAAEVELEERQVLFDAFLLAALPLVADSKVRHPWDTERLYYELHRPSTKWKFQAWALIDGNRQELLSFFGAAKAVQKRQDALWEAVRLIKKIGDPFTPPMSPGQTWSPSDGLRQALANFDFLQGYGESEIEGLEHQRVAFMAAHEEIMTRAAAAVQVTSGSEDDPFADAEDEDEEDEEDVPVYKSPGKPKPKR